MARGLQWKIAARALVTGTERDRWHADGASCPRNSCGTATETVEHLFCECKKPRSVWAWVARVLLKTTGLDITSVQPPPGSAPPPLRLLLRFDGAARCGSGQGRGKGGGGALLYDIRTERLVWQGTEHMPNATNNEGEWRGLSMGLRAAVRLEAYHIDVGGDSQLVLDQLMGESKVINKRLFPDFEECKALLSRVGTITAKHYKRAQNQAADLLANLAADGVTEEFWADGIPSRSEPPRLNRSDIPDLATCLLGVPRHMRKALNEKPVSWFQVLRLSALRRIYESRVSALNQGLDEDAACIKRRISRDFVQRIQLRLAAGKRCGTLKLRSILPVGINFKKVSASDFYNIAVW